MQNAKNMKFMFFQYSPTVNACTYSSVPVLGESAHIVRRQPPARCHIEGDAALLFFPFFFTLHNTIGGENETNIVSFPNGAQIVVPICPSARHYTPARKKHQPIG